MIIFNLRGRWLVCKLWIILIRGTASDVFGMESDTWLRNMVRERSTVTSEIKNEALPYKVFPDIHSLHNIVGTFECIIVKNISYPCGMPPHPSHNENKTNNVLITVSYETNSKPAIVRQKYNHRYRKMCHHGFINLFLRLSYRTPYLSRIC